MNVPEIQPAGRGEEEEPEPDKSPAPQPSGLTDFLVENPSSAGITREALVEAVQALHREREYLRRARNIQLADFEASMERQRQHSEEVDAARLREAQGHRREAEGYRCEVRAHRKEAETVKLELAAVRTEIEEVLCERQKLLADRDAWQARANVGMVRYVSRKLREFALRVIRSF